MAKEEILEKVQFQGELRGGFLSQHGMDICNKPEYIKSITANPQIY